jgi:hypothetical protein
MSKPQTSKSPSPTDVHVGKRVCMRRKMLSMSQTDLGNGATSADTPRELTV